MKSLNTSHAKGFTQHHFSLKSGAGFTLIEILILLGLFAILVTIGLIMGMDSIVRSTVHNERDTIVIMLSGTRARALANVNEEAQGIHITDDKIILFEGTSFPGTNQRSTDRNDSIVINPEPATIVFSQLQSFATDGSDDCDPSCTITLSGSAQTAIIEINSEGRIEW